MAENKKLDGASELGYIKNMTTRTARRTQATAPHTTARFADAVAALDAHVDDSSRAEKYADRTMREVRRREAGPQDNSID